MARLKIIVEEKAAAPAKGWTRYAHQYLKKGRTLLYLWHKPSARPRSPTSSFRWASAAGRFRGPRFRGPQSAFAYGQRAGFTVEKR